MKLKKGYIMKELAGKICSSSGRRRARGISGNDTDECDRRIFMGMSLRREDKTGIDRSVFGEI